MNKAQQIESVLSGAVGFVVVDYENPTTGELARFTLNRDPVYFSKVGRLQRQLEGLQRLDLDTVIKAKGWPSDIAREQFDKIAASLIARIAKGTPSESSKVHAVAGEAKGMVSHEDTGKRYVRGIVDARSGRRVIREATHPRKPSTMGEARRIRVSLERAALGGSWRQFQIDAGEHGRGIVRVKSSAGEWSQDG
jgi:hypothetical protein